MWNRTQDLWIRSIITLLTELRGRTEKVRYDLGGELRQRESKGTYIMNVVSRSTMNTNGGTVKTLKCRLKCSLNP